VKGVVAIKINSKIFIQKPHPEAHYLLKSSGSYNLVRMDQKGSCMGKKMQDKKGKRIISTNKIIYEIVCFKADAIQNIISGNV